MKRSVGTGSAAVVRASAVTGSIVHETKWPVVDYVNDPETGETKTIVVSPPEYEPVMARITAYGAGKRGGQPTAVAYVVTEPDGGFRLDVPAERVSLQVTPTSTDWQPGWLWTSYAYTWASSLQWQAPDGFDVLPPADVGMIQVLPAVARGEVIDAVTRAPIARAKVTYVPVQKARKSVTAKTNAAGQYRLEGLDYDEYHIDVEAPRYIGGCLGGDNRLYQIDGEACTWGPGDLSCQVITMLHRCPWP